MPAITKHKLLIIEDDPKLIQAYKLRFSKENYDIRYAIDGEQGVAEVETFNPDVIILDVLLPKLDGMKVLKKIRENPNHQRTKVIVCSNVNAESISQDIVTDPNTKFFQKNNVSLTFLGDEVHKCLKQ